VNEQNILILDEQMIPDPEVRAMLQAFYSRSPMPIRERLASLNGDDKELRADKIRAAINRHYLGYGHASIADCATATVFIEGVSMLAAKVIQDDPLYNGQECSTRYLDFSKQPFLTATENEPGESLNLVQHSILEGWRDLYRQFMPKLLDWALQNYGDETVSAELKAKTPREQWGDLVRKSCNAIAFDVARSLLPCGAATSVAWTTTLRRLSDRCREMTVHPLSEVRQIGRTVYTSLQKQYPNTFKVREFSYDEGLDCSHFYYNRNTESVGSEGGCVRSLWMPENYSLVDVENIINNSMFSALDAEFAIKEPLPRELFRREADHLAYFNIGGLLDFGSFRDLQRHRNGLNRLPIVGSGHVSFNSYYSNILKSVDSQLFEFVEQLVQDVGEFSKSCDLDPTEAQYLYPMGVNVDTNIHWTLGQLRYVLALRSKTSVHPTARTWIHALYDHVDRYYPMFIRYLEVDKSPDYYQSDRGEQTIKEVPSTKG
jgi:thymidylate synthase ThyX